MSPNIIEFAQVMVIILGTIAGLVGIGLGTRYLWRIGSRAPDRALPDAQMREELHRLQMAVDTIAIEVERISEAQRFTVSLLSDGIPSRNDARELPSHSVGSRGDAQG